MSEIVNLHDLKSQLKILSDELDGIEVLTPENLEQFRIKYIGSKNIFKDFGPILKSIPNEDKKEACQALNQIKSRAEMLFQSLQEKFVSDTTKSVLAFDSTAPGYPMETGSRHPISIVLNQIINIFQRIGFTIAEDR